MLNSCFVSSILGAFQLEGDITTSRLTLMLLLTALAGRSVKLDLQQIGYVERGLPYFQIVLVQRN